MERNDCDWVEFEEMYGLCQWVGINVFYIVLFRLELVSSSNVIRFYGHKDSCGPVGSYCGMNRWMRVYRKRAVQVDIMERDDCGWVEFEEMYGLCRGGKVIWDDSRSVGDIPVITLTCAYHVLKWT